MVKGLRAGTAGLALAAAMVALGGTAGAQAPELLPDLQGLPAEDLRIQTAGGVRDLKLTTSVGNAGDGAFEVFPEPTNGDDCDGDGGVNDDRFAFQRVFSDADGNGSFDRDVDTGSVDYPIGCMIFHPAHDHWHFEDFASFELRIPGTDQVVASTAKVGFCLLDIWPYESGLSGHPEDGHYDTCSQDEVMGISVGWADTYHRSLPGQEIDIRNVPDGEYCLTVTGDPSDIVRETDELNNEAETRVAISGSSVTSVGSPCVIGAVTSQGGDVRIRAAKRGTCKKKAKRSAKKKPRRCRQRARVGSRSPAS